MIFRINYFTLILLSLTVVLSGPVPLPERPQNGALESISDLKLEGPRQIDPRDTPSVAITDGPPDSAKIVALKQPGENLNNSPQNSGPSTPASDSAKGQNPTNDNSSSKDAPVLQPKKGGAAAKQQNSAHDSNVVVVEVVRSQEEPALGRAPENAAAKPSPPPAGEKDRTPRPQDQQGKIHNSPVANGQSEPGSMKEKPKAGYMPGRIQLFGRPHQRPLQYAAG